jgi:hypothetical protein
MILTRPCNHGFASREFTLLAGDMKNAFASKNEIDLI